jgi:SAM-dependent methyltransferase
MNFVARRSIYVSPPACLSDDLLPSFYHVMELPNGVTTPGAWDLRAGVDDYLGRVDFRGKRVLEIGPASGFLTVEMERRGADVTVLDIPDDGNWDFVPFPDNLMDGVREHRASDIKFIKNTFWYTHTAFDLKAKVVYADAGALPDELGDFDIVLLGAVLLHVSDPHRILAGCAKRARTLIITEVMYPDIEAQGAPLLRLHPTPENKDWGTWWHFTSTFFTQYLGVLGFEKQAVTFHKQRAVQQNLDVDFFTVVASRA